MALTGIKAEEVNASLRSIQNSYNELMRALVTDMNNQFVNEIANLWVCKEAVDFFNGDYTTTCNSMKKAVNETFRSIFDAMNGAAATYAANDGTSGGSYTRVEFSEDTANVNVGTIKENEGGLRGADVEGIKSTTESKLGTILGTIQGALSKTETSVETSGFYDAESSQANALRTSISTIKNSIEKNFEQIKEALVEQANATSQKFGDIKSKIASETFNIKE